MFIRLLFISISSLLLFQVTAWGQTPVLGIPLEYKKTVDPYRNGQVGPSEYRATKRSAFIPWIVVIDRENALVYDKPGGNAVGSLPFGSRWYVNEEQNGWLQLTDGKSRCNGLKTSGNPAGYVEKKNLLLWEHCLANPRNHQFLQVLLVTNVLNRANIPACDAEGLPGFFKDPGLSVRNEEMEVDRARYFVFKKEAGNYLLGSGPNADSATIGWMSGRRLVELESRIELEPEFSEAGFLERKNNPRLRTAGFISFSDAQNYFRNSGASMRADWKFDPVDLPYSMCAASNPRRMYGEIARWPLISRKIDENGNVYFHAAVFTGMGELVKCPENGRTGLSVIPIEKFTKISRFLHKYREARNINIVFVMENGEEMAPYRKALVPVMQEIKRKYSKTANVQVKFGGVIYGHVNQLIPDSMQKNLVSYYALSYNVDKLAAWITEYPSEDLKNTTGFPVMYKGVDVALARVFNDKDATNILVLVGKEGDFKVDPVLYQQFRGSFLVMDQARLLNDISDMKVTLLGIQCEKGKNRDGRTFALQAQRLILNGAKERQGNSFSEISPTLRAMFEKLNFNVLQPEFEDPDGRRPGWNDLKNGLTDAGVFTLPKEVSDGLLTEILVKRLGRIVQERLMFADLVSNWGEERIDSQGFTREMAEVLALLVKDYDVDKYFTEAKVQLFTPMYFCRRAAGAENPGFALLFDMSERARQEWQHALELVQIRSEGDYAGRRESIFQFYRLIAGSFREDMASSDYLTCREIIQMYLGADDVVLGSEALVGFPAIALRDVQSERKCSAAYIDDLTRQLANICHWISRNLRNQSEFTYQIRDMQYFRVPVNDIFSRR